MKSLKSFTLYALHPNSPLLLQSVAKNIETHYIFMEKSLKMLILIKDTQNSPSKSGKAMSSIVNQK